MSQVFDFTIGNVVGPQGPEGEQGPKGETGATGATGPRGETGPQGIAATVEVAETETVSPDTEASVENVGTIHEARLKFRIPQGEKGDTGNGISSIIKTGTAGLVDTYTVTYTDGSISTFTVTNGANGEITASSVANAFSAATAYSAGDNVIYSGQLYQFTADHPAGAWIGTDASQVKLADDVSALKSALNGYNTDNCLPYNYTGKGKYLKQTYSPYVEQSKLIEAQDTIDGVECDVIGINITANDYYFLNEWSSFIPDYTIVPGNYFFSFDYKSDTSISDLDIIIYLGNGVQFNALNNVVSANIWNHIEIPITLTSGNSTIQIRLLSDTSCLMKLANIRMTIGNPKLAKPVERIYLKNTIAEITSELLQVSGNLYSGKYSKDNYYKEYSNGVDTANSSYAISDKIYVLGGEKYTFNEHHHVFAYDKYDNAVALWRASDFENTITVPLSAVYLLANINKGWSNPLIVNHGESIIETEYYRYDGGFILDSSIPKNKLIDGSVTAEKLSTNSVTTAKIADGNVTTDKLANKSVAITKLADEVVTQFTNGANLQNGTVSKAALTNALIEFIEAAGGGTITNNADDLTIKVNESDELYVNSDAFNIVFVDTDTAYSSAISRISAISGKVVLMLKGNITGLANNTNFPSNLMMVIGLGGIFDTTRTGDTYVYFPEGCRFVCGNYQLFNQYVMPRCTSGYLDGEAKVIWWGAVADGETVVTSIFNCLNLSTFKVLRFTPGVYRGYFNNTLDGRTLIFDEGAIIDGVVHIAYGSSLGASTKRWCKNTKVIGKVVSTVRVGGAQIDGLSIPDGIEILGTNASYHNQTSEGGPKGVHWHFGCKNLEIGKIVVHEVVNLSAGYSYALGIDTETNEEIPHNIHIKRLIAGQNASSYYDVLITKAYNISIGEIIAESGNALTDSLYINYDAHDIEIGKLTTKFGTNANGKSAVFIGNVENVKLGTVNIIPDVSGALSAWGIFFSTCKNVFVENVHTKYMAQGLRLVNAINTLVVSHVSENDTTPSANSGSVYQILKTFN